MKSILLVAVSVGAILAVGTCIADTASEVVPSDDEASADRLKSASFASAVVGFSSEYNNNTWSAEQALGSPNVYPQYGDIQGAWASLKTGQQEFIELKFPYAMKITDISVYETFHAGAITKIGVWNKKKMKYVTVYEGVAKDIQESRIFEPKIKAFKRRSNRIRLDLDCSVANSWCEIDAVRISGWRR